jgi:hypothetical protein
MREERKVPKSPTLLSGCVFESGTGDIKGTVSRDRWGLLTSREDLSLGNFWGWFCKFLLDCIDFIFKGMTSDGFLLAEGFANVLRHHAYAKLTNRSLLPHGHPHREKKYSGEIERR